MLRYIVKRLINLIPVLLIISLLLFALNDSMSGNPINQLIPQNIQSETQKQAMTEALTKKYNLDGSFWQRYIGWLQRVVIDRNLGESIIHGTSVTNLLRIPLRNTFILNIGATLISLIISIIIGIKSAVREGSFYDRFWQVFSLAGISFPVFFIGMIFIYIFAMRLQWLPPGMMPRTDSLVEWIRHLILPSLTLIVGNLATTTRYVRNAMIDALSQDYIRTARAKGVSERNVIYSHAFRNALIPVVTVVVWAVMGMFSGAVVTESLFAYNGVGKFFLDSILALDYPVIMALNMFYAVLSVAGNLISDIMYSVVDPRVRLE